MPAINVARTDTFEQQRVKINEIATSIFNVTAGGSDLSTGNLRLGDGTKTTPSLAFNNETGLGIFRPSNKVISYVSSGKNILDITEASLLVYKDEILRKKSVPVTGGLTVVPGSGYEYGTYTGVILNGGSGTSAEATVFVDYFTGTPGSGLGYLAGTFTGISLVGGSGSGATVDFSVSGLDVLVTDPGSGYTDSFYSGVALTYVSGSNNGSGATAIVEVTGNVITNVSIANNGNNQYENGDVLTVADSLLGGGGGSGLEITVQADAGVFDFTSVTKGPGYTAGDVLTLPTSTTVNNVNIGGTHVSAGCTLTASSTTVALGAATNEVIPGMILAVDQGGSVGGFAGGATVTVVSITNSTTIEVDTAATTSGAADITFASPLPTQLTIPGGTANIYPGFILSGVGPANYTGIDGAEVTAIIDANTIEVDVAGTTAYYEADILFTPKWGDGGSTTFDYTINSVGAVETLTVTDGGTGYAPGDVLTIAASDLINPVEYTLSVEMVQKITFTTTVADSTFAVGDSWEADGGGDGAVSYNVAYVKSTGGNIDYVLITGSSFSAGDDIREAGTTTPVLTINTADTKNKYYFDLLDGNGPQLHPDLTFYVGETYRLNLSSSVTGHDIKFSTVPDGKWTVVGPIITSVNTGSDTVAVTSTTGISVGMRVEEAGNDPGQLEEETTVAEIVDATTVRLSANPTASGAISLNFSGAEYSDGVSVTGTTVDFKVTGLTPTPLYYYCDVHVDMAGEDGEEASITVDANNPRVFGSGFSATLDTVDSSDVITLDIETGNITSIATITSPTGNFTNSAVTGTLTAPTITGDQISLASINSSAALDITVGTDINLTGNVNLGTAASVDRISGDFLTTGEIKTVGSFNSNDALVVTDNVIESVNNYDLVLQPDSGRLAKVTSSTAFVLPVGSDADRPTGLAVNGAIRFNTDSNQYEGYSGATSSWASLGGVRDLDGNTYILAEASVGANDNTLWFINDNIVTQKFTPTWHEYENVKQIRSPNVSAPSYIEFAANTPVTDGQYIKWRNNIYVVPVGGAGTLATSGNEPTHVSGTQPSNTAQLTWFTSAVAPITFEEVEEVRISPLGSTPLVISGDLRLLGNTISTDINDLVISPNGGRKVEIDALTSLVVPVGTTGERGSPAAGSIRFNTTSHQFEGYDDNNNWGSLGGVKDVDQNTYIIPETAPGNNENILYFYNDGNNTLQLTTTALDFYAVDTIRSVTSDELEVTASLLTFDEAATTLDNTSATTTFLHSSKQYFDLGLSSGLYVEPVLRLDNQGDVFFNTTFGTGSFTGVKVFDGELKEFELADLKFVTEDIALVKGSNNVGTSVLYDTATANACKTTVVAHNPTTGEKEFIEFGVIDNSVDVFHTEYGNIRTGQDLIVASFGLNAQNEVVLTITLGAGIGTTQTVNVTVVTHITKK